MIEITSTILLLVSAFLGGGATAEAKGTSMSIVAKIDSKAIVQTIDNSIESKLRLAYAKTPILIEVARCESSFRHYTSDGDVVRGKVNAHDVGVMQINETYHANSAKKLGYDIMTPDGNIAYAMWLYKHFGTDPWKYSSKCWNPSSSQISMK